ncbi:hypothetical protein QBC46DRAFT_319353 [Diplogelasinospora grovesii]|uniref:BZIP domain-containing protein n=1 Tax=Diplogelasinospora grovesii TaxID=303347 RepID=A0AAN6N396_9PEZI|nr:hypothetical protein QBC46DRAFT_319353 [Diplogelasinospora grovesii]
MDSWSVHTPSPSLKFESSPTESVLSTPGEMFPSLFGTESASTKIMNPLDMLSPESFDDDNHSITSGRTPAPEDSSTPGPTSEKKPAKKRKSWGQVLPEPKTNLPPRKRAKTEDEKEQRRVERVLRNRRAAQSSRERKRQEVELLEKKNKELEETLRQVQQQNMVLLQQLERLQHSSGVLGRSSASFETLRPSPITLSKELFSSQDGHSIPLAETGSLEHLLATSVSNKTVDPASLSPTLAPISEAQAHDEPATDATPLADASTTATGTASPDATQHPAAMLCSDLQCRSAEAPPSWLAASQQQLHSALALLLSLQFLMTSASAMLSICQRPLMQITLSLKTGLSLPPTPAILNTIILLVTTRQHSLSRRTTSTSTSTTSSRANSTSHLATSSSGSTTPKAAQPQTRRSSTLRLRSLRKILTCSPSLARPLMDATMEALRLVSSEGYGVSRVSGDDASAAAAANGMAQRQMHRGGHTARPSATALPSKEVLLTLLWALKVEERRIQIREQVNISSKPGGPSVPKTTPTMKNSIYSLQVLP